MANEYGEIEQLVNDVTSLDTARMTLRWALERLNSIEKEKADLKKNLTLAEETAKRLQVKEASLTDAYSSRNKTLEEKEDFYTKLEATMSLLGEGKLDIQQLLKKEAKLDSLRHSLEAEYSDKFEELDRNQRSVIERWNSRLLEVESQYAGRLAEAQKKYDGLRAELEGEHQGRLSRLETSYKSREKDLNERIGGLEKCVHLSEEKVETRRRELEGEYLAKKRETEENYRKLQNMLEAGLEEKIRAADSDHAEQVRSLETSWQIERARLLEEQHVREAQFATAQDRIKEIENALAVQQETHHTELLKIISEKETAFRTQLSELEAEKSAKEATVRELQARLEKKAAAWDADRARLQADYDARVSVIEEGQRGHASSLEKTYEEKKKELENDLAAGRAEFEKEFNARLESERKQMAAEKAVLEEEKRAREEALAVNSARLKELESAITATREEHHKDLMERIRSGEASFREKLAGFEAEKRSYNETINKLTDELRSGESRLLEEKSKIAAEFESKSAIHAEILARTEASFGEERRAYEEKIAALAAKLTEADKASAMERENFKNELSRVTSEVEAMAEERAAATRADYENRKADLEKELAARYNDKLKALEAEKTRVNEELAENESRLAADKQAYNEAINKLTDEMRGKEGRLLEEKGRIAAEFEAKSAINSGMLARTEASFEEKRRAYEEKIAGLGAKLTEADKASALERENFKNELSRVTSEVEALAEERAAATRADYENRKADLEKEFAARYNDKLKALEAEKARVNEELAGNESRLAVAKAAAAAAETECGVQRTRLEAEAAARVDAAYAEAAAKTEVEKGNRQAERARLEQALRETSENFKGSQKEIGAVNAKLRQAEMEKAGLEERFNRGLIEARANYEKELTVRVKEAVATQTADLFRALEAATSRQAELSTELDAKVDVINALNYSVVEAKRDCEARASASVSEAVAARRAELEKIYARKQAAFEEDCQARLEVMNSEFTIKCERLAGENASLRKDIERESADAAKANARAKEQGEKLLAAEKAFHNEKIELQKAQITELEQTVADAVSAAVEMAEDRLRHAQEELEKSKKVNREEVKLMAEGFDAEKDQLLEEIGRRDRYIENADMKVQELERAMIKYRQTASGELMKNISDQDARFREMAAEEKARGDARIKQLESLLSAKEKLLAEGDKFYRQKQLELDNLHAALNMREAGFNQEIFSQKQELGEKEKELNEYRLKLEKDYALKNSELEQMKAELSRAILDYRKR